MIRFFSEDIDFKPSKPIKLKRWLADSASHEGFGMGDLNYVFCSDSHLYQMNVDYLQHDTLTDIITFDNSETEETIEGDIFVSTERVQDNARDFGVPFDTELRRVLVHGLLHLCGYLDKTDDEAKTMRQKEDFYLARY